ncbi:VOC family protein [Rhodococcus chondri]|uniref:VOC family protein n=1 Tax=Rhodococcus chondri TaxID=3065941 RepID=A0ABU7JRU3_9NOCA|nr:VOC family protein [Rhodococcus sp. CC-R104]MEE2032747.1 VOC family protein [Rhodococcus sp. CC-R104]
MPEATYRTGTPVWTDLTSSDPQRIIPFYTELFGWGAEDGGDPQYGGYVTFTLHGKPVAGLGPQQEGNPYGNLWTVYIASDDASATAGKAAAAGGQVMLPAMQVGDQGTLALLADPAGAVVGLWQPDQHAGFAYQDEPGAPVWFETMSRNFPAALDFYRNVFEWDYTTEADTDDFRYSTATIDGSPVAGVMDAARFLPEGVPSFWQFYIGVGNADATVEAATRLGGSVVEAPQDSPYGRIATIADPLGAMLRIDEPPAGN